MRAETVALLNAIPTQRAPDARERAARLLADTLTRASKQRAAHAVGAESAPLGLLASVPVADLMPALVDALADHPGLLRGLLGEPSTLDDELAAARLRFLELSTSDGAVSPQEATYAQFLAGLLAGWMSHRAGNGPVV